MDKKIIFLCLFIICLFVSCSNSFDDNTKNQDVDNPSTSEKEMPTLTNPFFWGEWQRMDNGEIYTVGNSSVLTAKSEYSVTASSDISMNVTNLGLFNKVSENEIRLGAIPFFRKGGVNLNYKIKLVGFKKNARAIEDNNALTALSDITVKASSETYSSFSITSKSDDQGVVTLVAPTSGDKQTLTIENEGSITTVTDLIIQNDGDYMGTVAIAEKENYSLKITGIVDNKDKNDGYLYGNYEKEYPLTLTITNISSVTSSPSICIIEPADSNLIIKTVSNDTALDGTPISTLKPAATKSIKLLVSYGNLNSNYIDTGLNITVINSKTKQQWEDYVPLRFFKGAMPITIAAQSTENNSNAALNGFIIYPDGNSKFFAIPDKTSKVVYVPKFNDDDPYLMVFSGATVTSQLDDSTEMFYTVAPATKLKKTIVMTGKEALDIMSTDRINHLESSAFVVNESFEAYLCEGNIDYYKIFTNSNDIYSPSGKELYSIKYTTIYDNAPASKVVAGNTLLDEKFLPELPSTKEYVFAGWYDGEVLVEPRKFEITSDLVLNAKWVDRYCTVEYETDYSTAPNQVVVEYGNKMTVAQLPVLQDDLYGFDGWYFGDKKVVADEFVIKESVKLKAKWSPKSIINFESIFGTAPEPIYVGQNSIIEKYQLPKMEYDGYIFKGWFDADVEVIGGEYQITSLNKTLTAKWAKKCLITYLTDFGNNPSSIVVPQGYILTNNELPSLTTDEEKLFFAGWYISDTLIVAGKYTINDDITLVAKWATGYTKNTSNIGDIVLMDGRITKPSTITSTEKSQAIGVIFGYDAEDFALMVGLNYASDLSWFTNVDGKSYDLYFKDIACSIDSTGNYTGDADGSDNWEYICSVETEYTKDPANYYPAFNFALSYADSYNITGGYSKGWYLPSLIEIYQLYKNQKVVDVSIEACGGTALGEMKNWWTSSQDSTRNVYSDAADFMFSESFYGDYSSYKSDRNYVCAIRKLK